MSEKPVVSICCITYNHAPFLRKCLDGFLMQQTSFPIEILIHDDASTDGTDEIIREYAARLPEIVFPLFEEENQYSKPNHKYIDLYNYERAQGKYIAYCEGDDFWTDPKKLQKQVDFLEANPDYSVCFHDYSVFDARTGVCTEVEYIPPLRMIDGGVDVDFMMCVGNSYGGQPLTMVFRKSMYNFDWPQIYKYYRDTHEIYHLLKSGKGRFMDFVGGVYVKHDGGISTSASITQSCFEEREHILELYLNTRDCILGEYLKRILIWNHDVYQQNSNLSGFHQMMRSLFIQTPRIAISVYKGLLKKQIKKIVRKIYRTITHCRLQPIPVFCIHQVSDVFDPQSMWECDWMEANQFKQKIMKLQDEFVFISLQEAKAHLSKDFLRWNRYAVLTADDGWESLKNILPWLAEQRIPITLFLNPLFLDGKHIRERDSERYLTNEDIVDYVERYSPFISIASHGWSHDDCSLMSFESFQENVIKAESFLNSLPEKIPFYAFTYGRYRQRQKEYLYELSLTPVLMDGMMNYDDNREIHRVELDAYLK